MLQYFEVLYDKANVLRLTIYSILFHQYSQRRLHSSIKFLKRNISHPHFDLFMGFSTEFHDKYMLNEGINPTSIQLIKVCWFYGIKQLWTHQFGENCVCQSSFQSFYPSGFNLPNFSGWTVAFIGQYFSGLNVYQGSCLILTMLLLFHMCAAGSMILKQANFQHLQLKMHVCACTRMCF